MTKRKKNRKKTHPWRKKQSVNAFRSPSRNNDSQSQGAAGAKKKAEYTMVRVDYKERRLDEFISSSTASASSSSVEMVEITGSQDSGGCEIKRNSNPGIV
ncbi:hypothetical protein COOONC_22858 [Cooperia oncophora]